MQNLQIVKISLQDVGQLQAIGIATFKETFAAGNSEQNMAMYLDKGFSTEKLLSELSDVNTAFYFAKLGETIVGYLKLNFGNSQTELQNKTSLEIERIYVLQKFQRKQIGQLLYAQALEIALALKKEFIWLGVWEENKNAIQFYQKNGFVAFDKHVFQLGDDKQIDIMMKLNLKDSNTKN